jgi:hypothetical protein
MVPLVPLRSFSMSRHVSRFQNVFEKFVVDVMMTEETTFTTNCYFQIEDQK